MTRFVAASDHATAHPIYRVAGVRAVEERFLATVPLMERAGAAAFALIEARFGAKSDPIAVLCGPGNNGGDGFVVARLLHKARHKVSAVFRGDPARLPPDAAAAYEAFRKSGGQLVAEPKLLAPPALAIDALFGIGLARAIDGIHAEWIEWLNRLSCPVLAIDIPSGLDADTGRRLGPAVRATHTITFIALKPGLLTLDGPDCCGEITVDELELAPDVARPAEGHTLSNALFAARLRPRPLNSHKGMMGDAGIIGGATGMLGAALLAGRAALHAGAGRVFVGMLAAEAPGVDPVQPELMLRSPEAVLDLASALAVGPGLGRDAAARRLLESAVARAKPLVLDADALNLMSAHPVLATHIARRGAATLLTPHPAEAARLLGAETAAVQADRIAAAQQLATRFQALTALKGCGTVLAAPDGRFWINTSGNAGMASAGMGDVLTGLALALLAQGWPADQALLGAVHLHGCAADRLVATGSGPVGMTAGETILAARAMLNEWIAARR